MDITTRPVIKPGNGQFPINGEFLAGKLIIHEISDFPAMLGYRRA
jgi:hypothetical protein